MYFPSGSTKKRPPTTHRGVHHVGFAVPQSLDCVENVHHTLSLGHLTHDAAGAEDSAASASISARRQELQSRAEAVEWFLFNGVHGRAYSQTVYHGPALSLLPLTLPLVHLQDQLQEGALGGGDISVSRPAQVLELTDHQVPFLRLTSGDRKR